MSENRSSSAQIASGIIENRASPLELCLPSLNLSFSRVYIPGLAVDVGLYLPTFTNHLSQILAFKKAQEFNSCPDFLFGSQVSGGLDKSLNRQKLEWRDSFSQMQEKLICLVLDSNSTKDIENRTLCRQGVLSTEWNTY